MVEQEFVLSDIADADVDAKLDAELRQLLCACFVKDTPIFSQHRHFKQPPQYRWMVRDRTGRLVGHVAVHDKTIDTSTGPARIAGVAEVCVHPDVRRRGLVRMMMAAVNQWAADNGYDFGMLFGREDVYSSSGYRFEHNEVHCVDWWKDKTPQVLNGAMIREYQARPWPQGPVDLRGPDF